MKISLLNTGKTDDRFVLEGCEVYSKRLIHYCSFENTYISPPAGVGKLPPEVQKQKEAALQLKKLKPEDHVVLLDERGRQMRSTELANWLNDQMIRGTKRLVFVSGGAFGFHSSLNTRANDKIALSLMTFPHQLVRLIFLEQLYRAFTIIRNEPYHNE